MWYTIFFTDPAVLLFSCRALVKLMSVAERNAFVQHFCSPCSARADRVGKNYAVFGASSLAAFLVSLEAPGLAPGVCRVRKQVGDIWSAGWQVSDAMKGASLYSSHSLLPLLARCVH